MHPTFIEIGTVLDVLVPVPSAGLHRLGHISCNFGAIIILNTRLDSPCRGGWDTFSHHANPFGTGCVSSYLPEPCTGPQYVGHISNSFRVMSIVSTWLFWAHQDGVCGALTCAEWYGYEYSTSCISQAMVDHWYNGDILHAKMAMYKRTGQVYSSDNCGVNGTLVCASRHRVACYSPKFPAVGVSVLVPTVFRLYLPMQ